MSALPLLEWRPRGAQRADLQARFEEWLAKHPEVYDAAVRLARQWRRRHPDKPVGIARLFEVMRWDLEMRAHDGIASLNNDYRSRLSRLIAAREPDLASLFRFRALRAA